MNFSKKILAATIIAGTLPVTAALAGGFGPLTNSTLQHSAAVLSNESRGVEAYLTLVEAIVKSTDNDGTGSLADGTVMIGLDSGATLAATFPVGGPTVVTLTINGSTGSILDAGDTAVFTGLDGPGGVNKWSCVLTSAGSSIEVAGPTAAQVIQATVAMSSGVFASCVSA